MDPQIRRLTYADLPQVVAIERRAFPAPWSLAMFVLELSKPSGICLAALRDGELTGYLICSRYDTVWRIMNVAIEPSLQRQNVIDGGGKYRQLSQRSPRSHRAMRQPPARTVMPV